MEHNVSTRYGTTQACRGGDVGDSESAALPEPGQQRPPLWRGIHPRCRRRAGELGTAAAGGEERG
jgi:hypothetical protein